MKNLSSRFAAVLFCLMLFGAGLRADDCDCNPLETVFKAQVLLTEENRYAAMTKPDLPALAALLSDDLVYAHSNGKVQSKPAFLEDLKTGKMRYRKITMRAPIIRLYGEMAIVNGVGDFEISIGEHDEKATLVYTAVYILKGENTGRRWQLASWHSSAISAEKSAERQPE